jgi:hypothetical protein
MIRQRTLRGEGAASTMSVICSADSRQRDPDG